MRRFSDRSLLVSLGEINVTPLLDLAFVLLVIFMITTPLLDQGMDLVLPRGGSPDVGVGGERVCVVEVSAEGRYFWEGEEVGLGGLGRVVGGVFGEDPGVGFYLRADRAASWESVAAVVDLLTRLGVPSVSMRTEFSEG